MMTLLLGLAPLRVLFLPPLSPKFAMQEWPRGTVSRDLTCLDRLALAFVPRPVPFLTLARTISDNPTFIAFIELLGAALVISAAGAPKLQAGGVVDGGCFTRLPVLDSKLEAVQPSSRPLCVQCLAPVLQRLKRRNQRVQRSSAAGTEERVCDDARAAPPAPGAEGRHQPN